MPTQYISQITLPSGNTYSLKDSYARSVIQTLVGGNAVVFIGVSSARLTDGGVQTPVVNNVQKTPAPGQLFFYGTEEFIWGTDGKWHALGSLDSLGTLAYKDTATGSFTPEGTIDAPTFTGSSSNVTITATNNNSGNYQPAGTISGGSFTGSNTTFTGKFTPSGNITTTTKTTTDKTAAVSPAASGDVTYTPAGTISQPQFTGSANTSTGKFTPSGQVSLSKTDKTTTVSKASSGAATYTPEGSVGPPTISVKTPGSTTKIQNPTSVNVAKTVVALAPGSTAPDNNLTYYSVSDETLTLYQLGYTTGASITTEEKTVKTGDAAYQASAPTFTGTGARLITGSIKTVDSASFTGTQGDLSVSGTASGLISAPTFSGTGVRLVTGKIPVPSAYTSTFAGTEGDISASGTPKGNVSAISFTGTKVQLAGTTTAKGSISAPVFHGLPEDVTVS